MEVIEKIPLSLTERLELPEVLRVPASFEDFLDIFEKCEYKIEYHNGEIISMGYASEFHELLVSNVIGILHQLLKNSPCRVYGSNHPVFVPGQTANYNPDVLVVCGETQFKTYRKTMNATLNPSLVIEVLSKTTQEFDFIDKSANYKKISSLQQMVFIDQYRPTISVFNRTDTPNEWLNIDYEGLDANSNCWIIP
jgi:Uma2 family endonuclease